MNDSNILDKVTGAIRKANNIMVTIHRSPSVDQVAAAIGLTFLLEKLDKFTTAIFSGQLPPATEFLNPDQTFESNIDVLRDFIITIDKDKVDRVRYRVEGDMVRILVTPYKTTLSGEDINYDDGEYNVDLVIVLGAISQGDLDDTLRGTTRILHDATVIGINNTHDAPNFATISWNDSREISYCEMVADLAEILGENEMSEATATALLTGIISETDQFRNSKTTSKSLQIAAKLMGYGANQQLISIKLEESKSVSLQATDELTAVAEQSQMAETVSAVAPVANELTETLQPTIALENPEIAAPAFENATEAPAVMTREEILQNINKNISNANITPITSDSVQATEEAESKLNDIMGDLAQYKAPVTEQNIVDAPMVNQNIPEAPAIEQNIPDFSAVEQYNNDLPNTVSPPPANNAVNIESFAKPTTVGGVNSLPMPPDFNPIVDGYNSNINPAPTAYGSAPVVAESLPTVQQFNAVPDLTAQNNEVSNTQFRIPGQ